MKKTESTENRFIRKVLNKSRIDNECFEFKNSDIIINNIHQELIFVDCVFILNNLTFHSINEKDARIEFVNCSFQTNLKFIDCELKSIGFKNTKQLKSLEIIGNVNDSNFSISNFYFLFDYGTYDSRIKLDTNFSFRYCNFNMVCFDMLEMSGGKFTFLKNTIGNSTNKSKDSNLYDGFTNCKFYNFWFRGNTSYKNLNFSKSNFKYDGNFERLNIKHTLFEESTFQKISFYGCEFFEKSEFNHCDFKSTTWYNDCKNLHNTILKFVACEFNGFTLFNNCKLNYLDIDRCVFDKSSSFTDSEFNIFKLYEVKFDKGVYFDEMKINNILNKSYLKNKDRILEWKRTLRAIKQELQKTDNSFDYHKYRNFELAAHYKELNIKNNFKDTFILWATKWSSNFGSWLWALGFTLISGFIWFSIFYLYEHNCPCEIKNFIVGLFRFFLVTDFHNPLSNDPDSFLNDGISWLIFIIGKIFIAFGIYEMIQSFRKFKA